MRDRAKSSTKLAADLQPTKGVSIPLPPVCRYSIKGRVYRIKSLLRKGNKQERLLFARNHKGWTLED